MSRRTDFEIADAVSAISAAPDPKACSRIFRKAIAAFNIDAFASGEIDLAALERTVFYAIGWPDTWHKFYVGTGVILRDPRGRRFEAKSWAVHLVGAAARWKISGGRHQGISGHC